MYAELKRWSFSTPFDCLVDSADLPFFGYKSIAASLWVSLLLPLSAVNGANIRHKQAAELRKEFLELTTAEQESVENYSLAG